jgi:RHS repeat-associated protein
MPSSRPGTRRSVQTKRTASFRLLAVVAIAAIAFPISLAQAKAVGEHARRAINSACSILNHATTFSNTKGRGLGSQSAGPADRAAQVKLLVLCPRRLVLYVGEAFTLVPLPLDATGQAVQGVALSWQTADTGVATVSSWGEVSAVAPGLTVVTAQAGTGLTTVSVKVLQGTRPHQTDADWDLEHAADCVVPVTGKLNWPQAPGDSGPAVAGEAQSQYINPRQSLTDDSTKRVELQSSLSQANLKVPAGSFDDRANSWKPEAASLSARPAMLTGPSPKADVAINASLKKGSHPHFAATSLSPSPLVQGETGGFFPQATTIDNAIGSPRFNPMETSEVNITKTKNNLGSSNYGLTIPFLNLGGRGIDVNLAFAYNAQLWGKDTSGATSKMIFDYNNVGPAPGWSAGYGRIIQNYDNTAAGNGSSVGLANPPGNYLLIAPDGTRIHLKQEWDSGNGVWNHSSSDGLFTRFNPRNYKLRYDDGTLVRYSVVNNRLLPTSLKNSNGDLITIDYRLRTSSFPNSLAINQITDSLGRITRFYYYGDPEYPANQVGGMPLAALAAITAPDVAGATRTLVRVEYQTITLQYNFAAGVLVDGPANNTSLTVVKRIYFPATGRGYLFMDYSSYGMCRYVSMRNSMTAFGGAISDGTEIAYTKYNFVDVNNQGGPLNSSPQYTERREWWQGKSEGATASLYTYSRAKGDPEVDTVTEPLTNVQVVTTSSGGQVTETDYKSGNTVLRSITHIYDPFNPTQLTGIGITNEAGNTSSVSYDYGPYNRVANVYEYDFAGTTVRRTNYQYSNAQAYIDLNMLRLATQAAVYDGSGVMKTKTNYTYDDYAAKGGMEYYGLTASTYPNNHDPGFDQTYTTRGNVTGVETFSSISPSVALPIRYNKYDVFGHAIEADVSCCKVKTASFSWATYFSQPDTTTDGKSPVVPYLTTSYQYDFNTGLLTSTTDPSGQPTSFAYDSAWRLKTVNAPSGASTTTQFDVDANGNDLLAYSQQVSYKEKDTDTSPKIITSKSWFDGAGRVVRSGSGAGSSPASFDTVATQYDSIGRVLKQSNPYAGDSSGNGSPAYWTTNVYDLLSRVKEVDLPDDDPAGQRSRVLTDYNGAVVTVTDQVGRQRRSEVDGLGRLIKVTEQNPDTGLLDTTNYLTTYSYDGLDNLTGVNQGGQTRSFGYDALSRMSSQTTPEGGVVSFTYTDFGAVLKRTDARIVETHYHYDSLNRLNQVWYTGENGSDDPTVVPRPQLPSGVAATTDVTISYKSAAPGNGQVDTVIDGAGSESYAYDSLGRATSKTRAIDSSSYQTQYQYNQLNQLTLMIYPSGKRVRTNHDSRGRMSGLDKVDAQGNLLSSYMSSVGYNSAGQVTGDGLGNGVNESYGYSADRLQLTGQTATAGATSLINVQYVYQTGAGASGTGTTAGNTGQLLMISGPIGPQSRTQTFTYDDLGRLATANGKGLWGRRFSYDRWGNRTSVQNTISGQEIQNVTLLPQSGAPTGVPNNQIATVNGVNYNYDASGNLTSDIAHNYQYDAESRMVTVDGGSTANSSYDSSNRRMKKVAGGVTTHYVWEGSQVIAEYNGSTGGLISEYVFAGSRMVAREQSGVLRYFLQDRLSTRLITDSSGTLVGREDHLPFGEDSGTGSGESEKHRFTSYERDSESNTDYAMNRQYATTTGRFLQPDPAAGTIGAPPSLNRYAYVENDPINSVDPYGLFPIIILPPINLGQIGEITVTAGPDSIVPIVVGPFGPGEWPNITIDPSTITQPQNPVPERLSDCLKKILGEFYNLPGFLFPSPLNLNNVRLHNGLPSITKFAVIEVAAITLGNNIYFGDASQFTISNIAHELVHTEQYARYTQAVSAPFMPFRELTGIAAFGAQYLGEYAAQKALGKSDDEAYNAISFEKEAFSRGRSILETVRQKYGENPCGVRLKK